MLKAVFGGKEETPDAGVSMKDPAAVRSLLVGLRARQASQHAGNADHDEPRKKPD